MKINITQQDREGLSKVFENFGRKKTNEEVFYDLCFTILAPQTKFQNNIKVIQKLKELDFYYFGEAYEGYLGLEKLFQNIAKQNGLSCAELDSFLWKFYSGTSWEDFKY